MNYTDAHPATLQRFVSPSGGGKTQSQAAFETLCWVATLQKGGLSREFTKILPWKVRNMEADKKAHSCFGIGLCLPDAISETPGMKTLMLT